MSDVPIEVADFADKKEGRWPQQALQLLEWNIPSATQEIMETQKELLRSASNLGSKRRTEQMLHSRELRSLLSEDDASEQDRRQDACRIKDACLAKDACRIKDACLIKGACLIKDASRA